MGVMFKPERFTCSGQKDLTFYENGILRINPELKGLFSYQDTQFVMIMSLNNQCYKLLPYECNQI